MSTESGNTHEKDGLTPRHPKPPAIPDHTLVRIVGGGSYGEVWMARNVMGTFRAVKIIYRDRFDSDRPYEREFAGIQHFEPISRSHEGFVDILHVGRNDAEGFFYYVMELAEATSMEGSGNTPNSEYTPRTLASDLRARGATPVAESLPAFITLASALGFLHKNGLLHRDIKPANIIFVDGFAKFADIGLVTEAGGASTYVGTEGFIPPEGPGTPAADIYALGKVFYEVATGKDRLDFPSLSLEAGALEENRDLLEINAIFLKACANDLRQRYQSAEEIQADLALLQSGKSVRNLRLLERRIARARRAILALISITLISALFGGFASRQARVQNETLRRTEILRLRAVDAENTAKERLWRALLNEARALRGNGMAGHRFAALKALTNAAAVKVDSELRSEAVAALALPDVYPLPFIKPASGAVTLAWFHMFDTYLEGFDDGRAAIRNAVSGAIRTTVTGPRSALRAFIPKSPSRWTLMTYEDGSDGLWDTRSGAKPWVLEFIWTAADLSSDDKLLAFGTEQSTVKIVYPDTRALVKEFRIGAVANGIHFSPNTDLIGISGNSNVVEIWNWKEERRIQTLNHVSSPVSFAWNETGQKIAVATFDRQLHLWDAFENKQPMILSGHKGGITDLSFLAGMETLISCSWDGTVRGWDVRAGLPLWLLPVGGTDVQFDPISKQLGFRNLDNLGLERYQFQRDEFVKTLPHDLPPGMIGPNCAVFSADSRSIATRAEDGWRLWAVENGTLLLKSTQRGLPFFESNGEFLLASHDGLFHQSIAALLSSRNGKEFEKSCSTNFSGHVSRGTNGVWAWIDDRAHIWKPGGLALNWDLKQNGAETVAISPNGQFLATGTRNGRGVKVWDAATGRLLREQRAQHGGEVVFSPDNQWLLTGSSEEYVLAEAKSGVVRWKFPRNGAAGLVGRMDFSPDLRYAALAENRSTVVLVDSLSGAIIVRLEHPSPEIISQLSFSPDGRHIAAICETHVLQLWDLAALRKELSVLGLNWE